MDKRQELYRGKAKTVYATDDPRYLVMHFRDDVSAFDGVKVAQLAQKGETNNRINAYVMGKLAAAGVPTHFVRLIDARESLVRAMRMLPVECVVRNVCAGSMAKRYGIAEGTRLPEPIFEFFLKSDALHDPLCNDDHIRVLGWATPDEIAEMRAMTHKVNAVLKPLFANAGIDLVDYKLEFGHPLTMRRARWCSATSSRRTDAAVGRAHRREARQGPLPPRSRRGDRALPRGRPAHRRAALIGRRRLDVRLERRTAQAAVSRVRVVADRPASGADAPQHEPARAARGHLGSDDAVGTASTPQRAAS
jgi:phosphoribosylaminoimidazole-succinocarboxamide synthase